MGAVKWKGKSDPARPWHFYTQELLAAMPSLESIYKHRFAWAFA